MSFQKHYSERHRLREQKTKTRTLYISKMVQFTDRKGMFLILRKRSQNPKKIFLMKQSYLEPRAYLGDSEVLETGRQDLR